MHPFEANVGNSPAIRCQSRAGSLSTLGCVQISFPCPVQPASLVCFLSLQRDRPGNRFDARMGAGGGGRDGTWEPFEQPPPHGYIPSSKRGRFDDRPPAREFHAPQGYDGRREFAAGRGVWRGADLPMRGRGRGRFGPRGGACAVRALPAHPVRLRQSPETCLELHQALGPWPSPASPARCLCKCLLLADFCRRGQSAC